MPDLDPRYTKMKTPELPHLSPPHRQRAVRFHFFTRNETHIQRSSNSPAPDTSVGNMPETCPLSIALNDYVALFIYRQRDATRSPTEYKF